MLTHMHVHEGVHIDACTRKRMHMHMHMCLRVHMCNFLRTRTGLVKLWNTSGPNSGALDWFWNPGWPSGLALWTQGKSIVTSESMPAVVSATLPWCRGPQKGDLSI